MKKNKILFLVDDFHIGGISRYIKEYSTLLSNNFDVAIAGGTGDLLNPKAFFPDAKVLFIKSNWPNQKLHLFKLFMYVSSLTNILNKDSYSSIHISSPFSGLILCLLVVFLNKKTKIITTFHGAYYLESSIYKFQVRFHKKIFHKLIDKFNQLVQSYVLKKSNKVVVLSEFSRKIIFKSFLVEESKIVLIPGFLGKKPVIKENAFSRLVKKNRIIISNIGRFEDRKGIDLLLSAYKKAITRSDMEVLLVLVSPVYDQELVKVFKQYSQLKLLTSLYLLPELDELEKEMLLEVSDAFIIPSKRLETFGFTIIEALRAGVPVLGTPVGSIPSIIGKVDKKLISSNMAEDSLMKLILYFLELSKKEKNHLTKKSKSVFHENFRASVYQDLVNSLYF